MIEGEDIEMKANGNQVPGALAAQGKTLAIVTHDRNLSAQTERVLYLLDGRLDRDRSNGS